MIKIRGWKRFVETKINENIILKLEISIKYSL